MALVKPEPLAGTFERRPGRAGERTNHQTEGAWIAHFPASESSDCFYLGHPLVCQAVG